MKYIVIIIALAGMYYAKTKMEEQNEAKDGDIVVAVLEEGLATIKRFYQEKTRVRLEPANSKMKPIFVRNVEIKGRVTGVIRKFGENF